MIRVLLAAPVVFLLILFALSNPQRVQLGLWPTDYVVTMPLSVAILIAMAVSFLLGAVLLWFSALGAGHRARRAERLRRSADSELGELRSRLDRANAELAAARAAPPQSPPSAGPMIAAARSTELTTVR